MISLALDPPVSAPELDALLLSAWGSDSADYVDRVLPKSLGWVCAYAETRLVGFVNLATDGGRHAFVLDTAVHADFRRRGIASALVRQAIAVARERGADWLHVDYEPHLEVLYRKCGFRPTAAGLISLAGPSRGQSPAAPPNS